MYVTFKFVVIIFKNYFKTEQNVTETVPSSLLVKELFLDDSTKQWYSLETNKIAQWFRS